jgi:hypothetical protein
VRWRSGTAPSADVQAAYASLVARLEAEGWQPHATGDESYQTRFKVSAPDYSGKNETILRRLGLLP